MSAAHGSADKPLRRWCAALWSGILLFGLAQAVPAMAQTFDDIEVRAQGDAQVLRIRFNAPVRFVQLAPTNAADLYTLRFELLQADETVQRQVLDEFRRVPAASGLPETTIAYTPEPGNRSKQLTVRLARPMLLQGRQGPNARTIELLVRAAPPASSGADPQPVLQARRFGLVLQAVAKGDEDQIRAIPSEFQQLEVTSSPAVVEGRPGYEIVVGYFASLKEAEAAQAIALPRFPRARIVDLIPPPVVAAGPAPAPALPVTPATVAPPLPAVPTPAAVAPASALAAAPAPVAPPVAPPVAVAPAASASPVPAAPAASAPPAAAGPAPIGGAAAEAAQAEVEREALDLLTRARAALAARQSDAAVSLLNDLLKLPPNAQTMAAQELIGNAWEQADDATRARIEYQLYMKLYPQGEGAGRVAQRLAALGAPVTPGAPAVAAAPRPWSGNVAQYHYGGKARTKSLVNIATGIDQATLSRTTESSIVTSVDLSGRLVGKDNETRAVVRGSGASNLLSGGHSSSSIGSVYVEHRRSGDSPLAGLAVRAGRQSPISGGLLGLFDGVSLAYPVTPGLKVDLMGGVPANPLISSPNEKLLAAVLEADTLAERWAGNFYLLQQSTEGITNRRALGAELRYAGDRWSLNGLLDYDGVFSMVNALSLHASFQAAAQTTVTMLVDERRAPSLQLSNALISSGASSLKTLLQTRSLAQVRDDALATSAIARQFLVSVARPLNARWQGSMDLRYSAVGALPAVGDFESDFSKTKNTNRTQAILFVMNQIFMTEVPLREAGK